MTISIRISWTLAIFLADDFAEQVVRKSQGGDGRRETVQNPKNK